MIEEVSGWIKFSTLSKADDLDPEILVNHKMCRLQVAMYNAMLMMHEIECLHNLSCVIFYEFDWWYFKLSHKFIKRTMRTVLKDKVVAIFILKESFVSNYTLVLIEQFESHSFFVGLTFY